MWDVPDDVEGGKMMEKKKEFLEQVKLALIEDPRSKVADITYQSDKGREIITVYFIRGGKRRINATCNSNGANFMEVGRAVYEGGARGEIYE